VTLVKVCCIASLAEAQMALAASANALGLVSAMPSGPGVISDAQVASIAAAVRAAHCAAGGAAARTFLLTARTTAASIAKQHAAAQTTTLQLVDHVPLDELRQLRVLCPDVELVQVVHVTGSASVDEAVAVAPLVDALLLDSGNPAFAVKELGGTGRTHDWEVSRRIRDAIAPLPLWLAGGLRPDNVQQAIHTVRPHGLDICSGVRRGGQLDRAALGAFMAAVRQA
jgi:phosphoribosylanthranilate isomerase